ncbi:MAG: NAD(P)/FAD-dependent oxidoreductase [Candidatus Lokiarchaeota archaeon]|nr:NAD(P)/FAD-dependent oxidoreductase [Candidatus Lokiarchaeota archaeon]
MATDTTNRAGAPVECDVVIVGGSIAGNYLASMLAGRNLSVHVIEAHETVGLPMKCAGIVSSKILGIMDIPKDLILNRISEARVFSKGKGFISVRIKDRPVVVDRIGLDRHFMGIAAARGATYHLGERATGIEPRADRVLVTTTRGTYAARVLAGCDGAHSVVARHSGIVHDFITGKQAIFQASARGGAFNVNRSCCELHFDPSWNDLFGWVIPAGGAALRVGIAARTHVADLFGTLVRRRFGCPLEEADCRGLIGGVTFTGGTIPVGLPTGCARDRVVLVGDAACQVKASTGGGIVMLAIAAKLAAAAILHAFATCDFSRRSFTRHYQVPFFKRARSSLKMHLAVHVAVKHFTDNDFSRLFSLAGRPSIKRELARTADMDFPIRFILRILGEPGFYWWVAGFLLRDHRILREVLGILLR